MGALPVPLWACCVGGVVESVRKYVEVSNFQRRDSISKAINQPGGGRHRQSTKHSIKTLTVSMGVAPAVARDFQGAAGERDIRMHPGPRPGPPGRTNHRMPIGFLVPELKASDSTEQGVPAVTPAWACCTARRTHDDAHASAGKRRRRRAQKAAKATHTHTRQTN